jgi:DNA-binding MarR family transcriptional regulator
MMSKIKAQFLKAKKSYTAARKAVADAIEATGLTPEQWAALTEIPEEGIRATVLAEKANLFGPSLSRMVVELLKFKVITKTVDGTDGRAFILRITPHGKKLLAKVEV